MAYKSPFPTQGCGIGLTKPAPLVDRLQISAARKARPDVQVTEDMYAPRSDYYVATFGDFDLDCLMGRGHTPLDAIVDLLDKAEG